MLWGLWWKEPTTPPPRDSMRYSSFQERVKGFFKASLATLPHKEDKLRGLSVQRGLQIWTVQSLGRSPRSSSARCFLLLALLINLKGTLSFVCNMDFIYRPGQGRLLLTKSTVENGTAVHSIITPGTWVCRMLSWLTVIRISALSSNL